MSELFAYFSLPRGRALVHIGGTHWEAFADFRTWNDKCLVRDGGGGYAWNWLSHKNKGSHYHSKVPFFWLFIFSSGTSWYSKAGSILMSLSLTCLTILHIIPKYLADVSGFNIFFRGGSQRVLMLLVKYLPKRSLILNPRWAVFILLEVVSCFENCYTANYFQTEICNFCRVAFYGMWLVRDASYIFLLSPSVCLRISKLYFVNVTFMILT